MDPLVPQNCYGAAIIRCLLFLSETSFCQSPGFHSSTMVVLWLLTGAENTLRASLDSGNSIQMHTLTMAASIYEIDDQDIISNSMLPQHSAIAPEDRVHPSLTDLLHWPSYWCCLELKVGTQSILRCHLLISESHPVLLLGQNGWFVLPFSEKLMSQVSALASNP